MQEIGYGTSYILQDLGYGGLSAYGDATADRSDETSSWIEVWVDNAGSDIVGYSGTTYPFPITWGILTGGEEFYNNNEIDDGNICLRNATLHESGTLGSDYIYAKFQHTSGTIYICFLCGQTGGCTLGYDTRDGNAHSEWVIVGRLDNPSYNPHKTPSISLSLPDNIGAWTKYGSTDIKCQWNSNGDPHNHNIYISSNGSQIYNQDSSNSSGDFTQTYDTPDRDTAYSVYGKITDKNDNRYYDETSYNRGVWGIPTIDMSLSNAGRIVIGTPITATINTGALSADTGSPIKVDLYVNGSIVKTWEDDNAYKTNTTHTFTFDYTPTSDGITYTFKAVVTHKYSEETNDVEKSIKTYVTPTVSDITGLNIFSPQDNATYSWTNNATNITNAGETSSQKITINNSSKTNVTYNNTSVNLAPSGNYWVQSIFSDSNRSVNVLSSKLIVTLTNNDSGVSASKEKSFQVQYQPTKNITNISVENQGKTIAIDADTKTTVQWKYPWNAGSAGVVSGFRIRVYSDSSYSTQVGNDHFVTTTYSNFITGPTYSIDLDNTSDLKRGVMNYATITPYYTYPTGGNKSYGPSVQVGKLIKPYKSMEKPVIAYPINNTTWHNKNFRVLFRLPEDDDYSSYTSEIQNQYKYSDVEIKINNITYAFSGTYTSNVGHPEIFSSDVNKNNTNNHRKYIAINPSLISSFADVSDGGNFKIQVRVQKGNYYYTDQEMRGQDGSGTTVKTWSEWSDEITLNKSSIAPQNLTVGLEIKASHYQTVHNWGLRLLACYPINNKDSGDVDQVRGNRIDGSKTQTASGSDEYEAVFRTMQNLMAGVNGYCTYDRAPVKFNSTPSFSALEEIITSAESGTDRYGSTGRNYMNLLTRYMNDYLK